MDETPSDKFWKLATPTLVVTLKVGDARKVVPNVDEAPSDKFWKLVTPTLVLILQVEDAGEVSVLEISRLVGRMENTV